LGLSGGGGSEFSGGVILSLLLDGKLLKGLDELSLGILAGG